MSDETYIKGITGRIIYLDQEGGWGFINTHAIKFSKIYFHWTGLDSSLYFPDLKENDSVKFNALKRVKGWKAINIEAYNEPTGSDSNSESVKQD